MLCALLALLFLPLTASAEAEDGSPRWTLSVEAIVLERTGGPGRTLVERVPGATPFYATSIVPGVEAFNSGQFGRGFSAGPKISLTYSDGSGRGVELSYFNVPGQGDAVVVGPDSPADWLVMRALGGFWQTQDFPYQGMAWSAATDLHSAEADGRFAISRRATLLAGVRWLRLSDDLQGTLTPADLTAPTWKLTCPACNLFQIAPDGPAGTYPPFWTTRATNSLYGVQVGLDGRLLEHGRLSLEGQVRIGLFDDNAAQSTGVSIRKAVYPSTAAASRAAFVSEAGLQLKYRLLEGVALKAGYGALWLDGVALAPGQIQETYSSASGVRALGVNGGSSVLFQGATFGLEYSF